MPEEIKNEDTKTEEKLALAKAGDTLSKLFNDRDNRDWDGLDRDHPNTPGSGEAKSLHPPKSQMTKSQMTKSQMTKPQMAKPHAAMPEAGEEGKSAASTVDTPPATDQKINSKGEEQPSEAEVLRKKLEKTEKVLAENQRYGRGNAQRLSNALKAVQKFADDGVLSGEEARELLETLNSGKEGGLEEESAYPHASHPSQTGLSQTGLFAPIFKAANQELQNIFKYTDDELLQDKVNAFDYFLSVGSKEELEQVLEDLTELLDDPVKLAKKMLSIGQEVYEESYKGIRQAGGFKNYLSQKDGEIEKLQKKIDKLEKKLLQYEDFDKPRYRMDETGSPEMGEVESSKPANDTLSTLFDERDKVRRK